MKKLLLLAVLLSATTAFSIEVSTGVAIGVEHVYVPSGFDANDIKPEIMVSGWLENSCYKNPTGAVMKKNDNSISVSVTATKYVDSGHVCLQILIPYLITIPLGTLGEGKYEIVINDGTSSRVNSSISIATPSSSAVDNYIYARVQNIKYDKELNIATISGLNPTTCLELERIKLVYNGENTYSVLPIMKLVSEECPVEMVPFEYHFKLPQPITTNTLLHVRSMDGGALNFLINTNATSIGVY